MCIWLLKSGKMVGVLPTELSNKPSHGRTVLSCLYAVYCAIQGGSNLKSADEITMRGHLNES